MQTPARRNNPKRAFTLLEVLIVVIVIGLLAGMLSKPIGAFLESVQYSAEREVLQSMSEDIRRSWDDPNQAANFGMISGTNITSGTSFDNEKNINASIGGSLTVTSALDWRMKFAARRNMSTTVPVTLEPEASALAGLAFNIRKWPRVLIAGPTNEPVQRYLLVSMMTPPSRQLVFPTSTVTGAIFDTIWNNGWSSSASTAPSAWSSSLTSANYTLWNTASTGNRTNASRLLVVPIVQPKYLLTVVNTSTTNSVEVDIGPYANAIVIPANSSAPVVSSSSVPEFVNGVPAGRMIVVRMGPPGSLIQYQKYPLQQTSTITVQ